MPLAHLLATLPGDVDVAVVRDGGSTIVAAGATAVVRADGPAALAALDELDRRGGWWAGLLRYELGRACEPFPDRPPTDGTGPDLVLARYDARLVLADDGRVALVGAGPGREVLAEAWARARRAAGADGPDRAGGADAPDAPGRHLEWASSLDRAAHRDAVGRILEHLDRGDCYQVNLTRRLWTPHSLDARALTAAVWARHPAPHAALVEHDGRAVVSASPERFLRREGDRVASRPIKGTGPVAESLARSGKDRAENVMIVDLVRNDLGRVCEYGSVAVPELCGVEAHPGLHHLVSTVTGRLRAEVSTADLLRATFPAASITGAPKPEVLRIVRELEPVRRGVYCGAVGWIDADRQRLDLNVAIRTFEIDAAGTAFGVGGGIVADSRADDEWAETELKAARLLALAATVPAREAQGRVSERSERCAGRIPSGPPPVVVWCNGDLVREDIVRISPFDHGLLTGDGVFESIVTERGIPFAWTRHLLRLRHSAAGLGLDLPSDDELRSGVDAVVAANGLGPGAACRGRIRITITGGVAPPGSGRGTSSPLVLVTATPLTELDTTTAVVTVPWTRNEHGAVAGLKTTSYAENVVALAAAHRQGASEALCANTAGHLCEGTGSNVFCVVDGELVTPPLSSGCLAGVTRALVQELTGAAERDLPFSILADVDEAFLTSTTRGVQAIASIDARPLKGEQGPATRAAAQALANLVASNLDP